METWFKKAGICVDIPFLRTQFRNISGITHITKYRNFQYRLLHNKIFCNVQLVYWAKVESNICNLCNAEKQTIIHLLVECKQSKDIWENFHKTFLNDEAQKPITFENVLFNNVCENSNHIINFLVLITKQYIYRCKCQNDKISWNALLAEYKLIKRTEIYNATVKRRWSPVIDKLET